MERLNKEQYLKRVIVVCWIALAICFGIKLFGGNLFEIMCNNENFIKVCEYADNHFWAYYLISISFNIINTYFFVLTIIQKTHYIRKELLMVVFTVLLSTFIKYFYVSIGLIFDVWQVIIMPALFTMKTKKKHWNIIFANVTLFIFQAISMLTKNIQFGILNKSDGILINAIFSIDVLIMVILYFAYINIRKERRN
jgi:hypothetical protein